MMAKQKAKTRDNESNRVTFDIRPGPAGELQKRFWGLFWQKLLSQVQADERKNPP